MARLCVELGAPGGGGALGFPLFYSLIVLLLYPHYCLTERFTVTWPPQLLLKRCQGASAVNPISCP